MDEEKGKAFGHRSSKIKGDLFQTPYSLTVELLRRESFPGKIMEPCQGHGAITRVLEWVFHGREIIAFDKYYGETKKDFFEVNTHVGSIITNPPYGRQTDKFVIHSRVLAPKVALLLRTNYLSGQARLKAGVYEELKHIYVFNRMPDLKQPIRSDGKIKTGMIVYAWFIWERGWKHEPTIRHLDISKYVLKKGE